MSTKNLELYEGRIFFQDEDFPVWINLDDVQKKGNYIPLHWHEYIELHYVVKGSVSIKVNNIEITAFSEDLVLINSNELHSGASLEERTQAIVVVFDIKMFSRELAGRNIIFRSLMKNDPYISKLLKDIYSEYQEQQIGYQLCCKGILMCLVSHLVRHYNLEELTNQDNLKRVKNLERLNQTIAYIQDHFTESLSNKKLAEMIHLSEGRFNHLFKESMEVAPQQYISRLRLKKAAELLRTENMSVSEIAYVVGFNDYNHFGRIFKRHYGCTPTQMRENKYHENIILEKV